MRCHFCGGNRYVIDLLRTDTCRKPGSNRSVKGVLHISRVWGSRHGGSIYSKALVEELRHLGWKTTLLAERFEDCSDATEGLRLDGFFRRGFRFWPRRAFDIVRVFLVALTTPGAMVIVQGDLPRLTYVLLQLFVPLIFIRQDGILTCPGNNRFLPLSRSVCKRKAGVGCLLVHRVEGCMGGLTGIQQLGRVVFRLRDRFLLRYLRHLAANSAYISQAHGGRGHVVYPPLITRVKPGAVPEFARQDARLPRDLHRLVFCSRLEAVKGAQEAIGILSLLPGKYHLDIIGDGMERKNLEKLAAKLQLSPRVRFLGWLTDFERDQVLASAGALLMTSLWDEAFGMAGVEALAQGTPVVAYDVGGIREWCSGKAGILVPCGNLGAAADAVRRLTEKPESWAIHSWAAMRRATRHKDRFSRDLVRLLESVGLERGGELRRLCGIRHDGLDGTGRLKIGDTDC